MERYRKMLPLKIFHNEEKGFVLLGMLFIMVLVAVTALGMNRSAVMQARMAANQTHAVQTNFGRLAAIEHAAWQLMQNPDWRTDPAGEDYVYNGITYNRKVQNSSIEGYTDAITITVTSPGGVKSASTSFRVTAASQPNFYIIVDTDNHLIRKVDAASPYNITRVAGKLNEAGQPEGGYWNGDDIPATSATLYQPEGVAVDSSGNIYIADTLNQRIRKIDASTKKITTVAGTGEGYGYNGDNRPATTAWLYYPEGVAVDASGNIYIADTKNYCIRKVDPSGTITTVAGIPETSGYDSDDDGGPATSAELQAPKALHVDTSGNIYIADKGSHTIRKVDAATQEITTVAGTGKGGSTGDDGPATSAKLKWPEAVSVDSSGNIYIADTGNDRIRRVDAGTKFITTVAGSGSLLDDDVPATSAQLDQPRGIRVDADGNIFIADTMHHVIRKVDAATQKITTISGNWTDGYNGDDIPATSAQLNRPEGVGALPPKKYYLIADTFNNRIRKVDDAGTITTVAGDGGKGPVEDGIAAMQAKIGLPADVHVDAAGNIFIAGSLNNRIRKVDAAGTITTVAGSSKSLGYSGDGGPATSAMLASPRGVYVDATGNIFIADTFNHWIRKVDAETKEITRVAGKLNEEGQPEGGYYNGDDIPATSATLYEPRSVYVDATGNIFIADTLNNRIRKVDAAGTITTVAGDGDKGPVEDGIAATQAKIGAPSDVHVDAAGNIFIAGSLNNRIRKVDAAGTITTVAGSSKSLGYSGDGGPATSAMLASPGGVYVDATGNIFIADTLNHCIRKVDTGGTITTVAGIGGATEFGYSGDGGPATSAMLNEPRIVYVTEAPAPPPPSSSSLEKVTEIY